MSVETENSYSGPYTTDGSTTDFPFSFDTTADDDVSVLLVDSAGAESIGSGYTVTRTSDGGTVSFTTAPPSGSSLFVILEPSFKQSTDFSQGATYSAGSHNAAFDRSALRDLALRRDMARTPKVALDDTPPTVPKLADRKGKAWFFDEVTGESDPISVDDFSEPARDAATRAEDAADTAEGNRNYYTTVAEGVAATTAPNTFQSDETGTLTWYDADGNAIGEPATRSFVKVLALDTFADIATTVVPAAFDSITTRSYRSDRKGFGGARYAEFDEGSTAANDAYVALYPRAAAKSSDGRYWRLASDQLVNSFMFGCYGGEGYKNPADGRWYLESGYTTAKEDDIDRLQELADYCTARYIWKPWILQRVVVGNGTLEISPGLSPQMMRGQPNLQGSDAICADDRTLTSTLVDGRWTNPVVRISGRTTIFSSCEAKLTVIGTHELSGEIADHRDPASVASTMARCDRTAIECDFAINGQHDFMISGFEKAGLAGHGLYQDVKIDCWIQNCGTNTSTLRVGAIDFRATASTFTIGSETKKRGVNALHINMNRLNGNPCMIYIDNSTTGIGEIEFRGKVEFHAHQRFHASPFYVSSGTGVVRFDIPQLTVPSALRTTGEQVDVMDIRNEDTTIWTHAKGAVKLVNSTGPNIEFDITHEDADPTLFSSYISSGSGRYEMMHNMVGATRRDGIKRGDKTNIEIQVRSKNGFECDANITAGNLSQWVPQGTGSTPRGSVTVFDDESGFRQHNVLFGDNVGSDEAALKDCRVETISPHRTLAATDLAGGRIDMRKWPYDLDISEAMNITGIIYAQDHFRVKLRHSVGDYTLIHGANLITQTAADVTVTSADLGSVLESFGGNTAKQVV